MNRISHKEILKLKVGDTIHPNGKYSEIYNINGDETDFFIEGKDVLFIREFLEEGFVVELLEDVLAKNENRKPRYGLFRVSYFMISSERWFDYYRKKRGII